MGLLDDAIREHLELKRRRGADPVEVAREQHEALDPSSARQHPEQVETSAEAGEAREETGGVVSAIERADDHVTIDSDPGSSPGAEGIGALEETAELDMKTVLENDEPRAAEHAGYSEGLEDWDANQAGARDQPIRSSPPEQEHLHFENDPARDARLEK
jgi:hypothetical protein